MAVQTSVAEANGVCAACSNTSNTTFCGTVPPEVAIVNSIPPCTWPTRLPICGPIATRLLAPCEVRRGTPPQPARDPDSRQDKRNSRDVERGEALAQEAMTLAMKDNAVIPLHHQLVSWAMKKPLAYAARTVAGKVHAGDLAPVLLPEALVIAPDGPQHARPR